MAALTRERDAKIHEIRHKDWLPVKAGAKIYAGALVVTDATGYAIPAVATTGLTAAGRAEETVDNTLGASGDKRINIFRGIIHFNNKAGDALLITDRYALAYIEDDGTVRKTAAGTSIAGRVVRVDSTGAWVDVDPLARS